MNGFSSPQLLGDHAIARLAARQHGVVAHRQLAGLGLGDDAVDYRVRIGRLHRIHHGVFAVGHAKLTVKGRWMAAVLAYGPTAVLSHRDAGALWQVRRDSRYLIDVTAPGRGRHPRDGITLHRPRLFEDDERTVIDGIPVTTLPRTLIDLAAVLRLDQLRYAFHEAERRDLLDLAELERIRGRFKRRCGLTKFDLLLAQHRPVSHMTRSALEVLFLEVIRHAGLPEPAVNMWLLDMEVDFVWWAQRLVVEVDGAEYHRTDSARDRDHRRDAALQAAGYKVLHVSDRWLVNDPDDVARTVGDLLVAA